MEALLTAGDFEKAIQGEKVIVMFSADWCPDCRVIEPVLPGIEEKYRDFTFYHAVRDELIEICQE